jgi:hypothetical protein
MNNYKLGSKVFAVDDRGPAPHKKGYKTTSGEKREMLFS